MILRDHHWQTWWKCWKRVPLWHWQCLELFTPPTQLTATMCHCDLLIKIWSSSAHFRSTILHMDFELDQMKRCPQIQRSYWSIIVQEVDLHYYMCITVQREVGTDILGTFGQQSQQLQQHQLLFAKFDPFMLICAGHVKVSMAIEYIVRTIWIAGVCCSLNSCFTHAEEQSADGRFPVEGKSQTACEKGCHSSSGSWPGSGTRWIHTLRHYRQ